MGSKYTALPKKLMFLNADIGSSASVCELDLGEDDGAGNRILVGQGMIDQQNDICEEVVKRWNLYLNLLQAVKSQQENLASFLTISPDKKLERKLKKLERLISKAEGK